jgi:hypothetical protein
VVDGRKVPRALPSPLDAWYALGSDRARDHLADELARYGYGPALEALRAGVAALGPADWAAGLYARLLGALRTLAADTTGAAYPPALRTAAWADKMLQTQLAAWAQARRDNILTLKQSYTSGLICEYPAGYVEPYPAFYAALRAYAAAGGALFAGLAPDGRTPLGGLVREQARAHFGALAAAAGRLEALAAKELRGVPFSAAEAAWLRETAVRRVVPHDTVCAGIRMREEWTGWYPRLFPGGEESPAVIADVHTNPETDPGSPLYPPRVLHVATGRAAAALLVADAGAGPTLYVGPASTYYEVVERGSPPVRLTDQEWRARLAAGEAPAPPAWTASFRVAAAAPQELAPD